MARLGFDFLNRLYGRTLVGTDGADSIYGFGGNDTIYGSHGKDYVSGGNGDDNIYAGNGSATNPYDHWGNDTARGGNGSDFINYYYSQDGVTIYGDHERPSEANYQDGGDTIWGSSGNDSIIGGGGDDKIYAGDGNDIIATDYGVLTSPGYYGTNTVYGGRGQDTVIVSGWDTIVINRGDSNPVDGQQDIIAHFDSAHANLNLPGDANSSNYDEVQIGAQGFNAALHMANSMLRTKDYVFVTDGHDGYVFADTDGDMRADIGVTITGLTSIDQFSHYYIT